MDSSKLVLKAAKGSSPKSRVVILPITLLPLSLGDYECLLNRTKKLHISFLGGMLTLKS